MYYKLKETLNLSVNGKITEKVEIKNHNLYIENDLIEKKEDGWYINGTYQGKGAGFDYRISEDEILDKVLCENIFEKEENADVI